MRRRTALVAWLLCAAGWRARAEATPLAAAGDGGRLTLQAVGPPPGLVLRDANGSVLRRYAATTLDGKAASRISALRDNPLRRSFIVALPDIAELWEISYDPKAEPIYDGLVHDWRMGEGLAQPGTYGVRRTRLARALERFEFDATGALVVDLDTGAAIHLDVRREIRPPRP
jgi:hypothetical protein